MQSARMSNLRHDCQIQPFYEHNWLGEEILYFIISAALKVYNHAQCHEQFLAQTGAQEMLIFVHPSVSLSEPSLSEALNLHLFGSDSLQEHSASIKQEFREQSESISSLSRLWHQFP